MIRAVTVPQQVNQIGDAVEIIYLLTVEIEGKEKPACVAEYIARLYS